MTIFWPVSILIKFRSHQCIRRSQSRVSTRPRSSALMVAVLAVALLNGCGGTKPPGNPAANNPAMVFDSNRAIVGSDASSAGGNIWSINADSSSATPLTRLTAASVFSSGGVWSPDGRKLAFNSLAALDGSDAANFNFTPNIWVMNADGSSATPLTRLTAANTVAQLPQWSPDGTKISFVSSRALDGSDANNGTLNLWIMNADGSSPIPLTRLTAAFADVLNASWSPDGTKIAFDTFRALDGTDAVGPENIWVINSDGSGAAPLTTLTGTLRAAAPQWSPDGKKLAFESDRALDGSDTANVNSTNNLWVVNADGSSATPLTRYTTTHDSLFPYAWSPGGLKIAFSSSAALNGSDALNVNSTFNVWTVNADGSAATPLTRITAANADNFVEQWSPNGAGVIFESKRALDGTDALSPNSVRNIWTVNVDGTGVMPVTTLQNANSFDAAIKP